MAIISTAAIVKGVLLMSKSQAAQVALLKLLSAKGIATTVSTGITVAGLVGVASTGKSFPSKTEKGLTQVFNGIRQGSAADFMDGLFRLARAYHSVDDFISDFNDLLESGDIEPEFKISFEKSLKDIDGLLKNEIERKSYTLLKSVENHLKKIDKTPSEYLERIKTIYIKHTFDLNDNYEELLGRCGRIYSEISSYNQSLSIGDYFTYDHYLAYCIAGWILDNLNYSCIKGKTQKQLAGDITNQIFAYLKACGLG